MVVSMLPRRDRPAAARTAAWPARSLTSFMVLDNSRVVAVISRTAAATWAVDDDSP